MDEPVAWWFRLEVVLAAIKTEQLLVAGCLYRLKADFVETSRLMECLHPTREGLLTESMMILLRDCRPGILAQHPELSSVPDVDAKKFDQWLADQKSSHGHWISFRRRP